MKQYVFEVDKIEMLYKKFKENPTEKIPMNVVVEMPKQKENFFVPIVGDMKKPTYFYIIVGVLIIAIIVVIILLQRKG